MSIKAFFVDALTSALDLGIATPNDVLRHATPEILAAHLPRPLWARLFTACLGAPRVDAQLVIETVGVPNLCEHLPWTIIWSCIADCAGRALGTGVIAPPPDERPAAAPTPAPAAVGPSIPPLASPADSLADVISELNDSPDASESRAATLRPRSPTAQRFRPSNTASGRLGVGRRPQAAASPASQTLSSTRRGQTEVESEPDPEPEPATHVSTGAGWPGSRDVAVDDSQLVDWQASESTGTGVAHDDDFSDLGRKR